MAAVLLFSSVFTTIISTMPTSAATVTTGAKVSFTFDDGLSSALLAATSLQKYGYTGTDYIITKCVGMKVASGTDTCAADATKDYMSWSDITNLQNTYGWEIGSHTEDHPLVVSADATAAGQTPLTDAQLDEEMSGSASMLRQMGFTPTDYASPYGDYDNRALAVIAKYYASHRTFQDPTYDTVGSVATDTNTFPYYAPHSTYPYNNYLLTTEEVQGNVSLATLKTDIDTAKANGQWLIFVFHNIVSGTASTKKADYEYSTANLEQLAAYVQTSGLPVVNIKDGLASGTNIMANSTFNDGIADGWTTDSPSTIVADKQSSSIAGHGSFDGSETGAFNSVAINGAATTAQTHLFSPTISVDPTVTYTLKNFVNVTSTTGGINYYVDEYDAAGNYLSTNKFVGPVGSTSAANVQVGDVNFKYTPTSTLVAKARVYADIAPGTTGYLDNMEWLAPAGTVVTPPVTTPPTTPAAAAGDVNGDGVIDALDLSTVLSNWNTGTTRTQGDLNGDGTVDALDLSTVLSNWSK